MDISGSTVRRWLRELGPFGAETCRFARKLGDTSPSSERLFVLGTPDFEPWHFVAHLGEQATRYGRTDLVPTLMRWQVPANAPAHLSVGVNQVAQASRRDTFLVIAPGGDAPELLERVADAKRVGSRILSMHRAQADLDDLSHEALSVDPSRDVRAFEITQHVVTDSAPEEAGIRPSKRKRLIRYP
ncbi:MAG: hypothetical protein ABSC41_00735 [Acidimicrobiales bacterium]|jgi:hypothetical protein